MTHTLNKTLMKLRNLIIISLILAGCKGRNIEMEEIRPVFYQEIKAISSIEIRSFSGFTQSGKDARLSFKVGGQIDKIYVQMGDTITKDQVIARLEQSDFLINLNKAEASLKNTETQLNVSKSALARIENLYINNNVSLSEFENAKAKFEAAEANYRTGLAQLEIAHNQLHYTTLKAPYSGVITSISVRENEIIGPAIPVTIISSLNQIEVVTAIPENMIKEIKRGDEVKVHFSRLPNKQFRGTISEISPGIGGVSAYPVVISLNQNTSNLLPGMTCKIEFYITKAGNEDEFLSLFVLPDAIGSDYTGHHVFVAVKTDEPEIYKVVKKNVTIGNLQPEGFQILDGVNKGDLVITAGLNFLYEGKKVRLLKNSNYQTMPGM